MRKWSIRVYDNSRYMDEDEAYTLKETFSTREEAVVRAKRMVDDDLESLDDASEAALLAAYRMSGRDPVVLGPGSPEFSAWDYAKEVARRRTAATGAS